MGYLFLFLICIALIAYFIYDYDQNIKYFGFLLKRIEGYAWLKTKHIPNSLPQKTKDICSLSCFTELRGSPQAFVISVAS